MRRTERDLAQVFVDPARFARGVLGVDPWELQTRILRAIAKHPRVAVKACHASSKTFTAAIAALWWVTRYPDGVVIVTAPTKAQVRGQVWKGSGRSPPPRAEPVRLICTPPKAGGVSVRHSVPAMPLSRTPTR